MQALAGVPLEKDDGAANCSRTFAASVKAGDRSAPGVLATLQASTLSAWAEASVQAATAATDFTADMLVEAPTLLVLKCPGLYMKVYGPYLGAVLQRLGRGEQAVLHPALLARAPLQGPMGCFHDLDLNGLLRCCCRDTA